MRYLHAVAVHERFVARGTYRYYADDAPTGLLEHWTIHELPDGAWFMRVDKDGRFMDGRSELIEAWRSPGGHIERFDIRAFGAKSDAIQQARATYTIEGNRLNVGRAFDGAEQIQETVEIPPDHVVQPGSYLFFGYALPAIVDRAPLAMISRFGFTADPANSFNVGMMMPSLTYYDEAEVTVDGKARVARHYLAAASAEVDGERQTQHHHYYIDKHNIFLKHTAPGMRVQLERYAHRP